MNRAYAFWTKQEQEHLLEQISKSRNDRGRVNWDSVMKSIPSKTKQQCKTYYSNIIKTQNNIKNVEYHKWSKDEHEVLLKAVEEEGGDWERIHQKYFQNIAPSRLRSQYYYFQRMSSEEFQNTGEYELVDFLNEIVNPKK
jgi:hypothetical protein